MRLYLHWSAARGLGVGSAPTLPSSVEVYAGPTSLGTASIPILNAGESATTSLDVATSLDRLSIARRSRDGTEMRSLGAWGLLTSPRGSLAAGNASAVFVPLGGRIALVGMRGRLRGTAGDASWETTPRFLALRPLFTDDTVSVGLRSDAWERKDDGTPALGAIPTLKWQRGWLVDDPHVIPLAGAPHRAPATVTIAMYDAFTLQPLAVLDSRRTERGEGTEILLSGPTLP
jgi:hypothetical protein